MNKEKLEIIFADLHLAISCCEEADYVNDDYPTNEDIMTISYPLWASMLNTIMNIKTMIKKFGFDNVFISVFEVLNFAETCCEKGNRVNSNDPSSEDTVVISNPEWLNIRSSIEKCKRVVEQELVLAISVSSVACINHFFKDKSNLKKGE